MNIKRFQKLKRLEKRLSFAQAQTNGQTLNLKFRPVWNEPCRRHFRTIFHVNIVFRRQNSLPFVQVFQRARWWKEWRLRNRFKIKRSTGIRLNDEPRASDARSKRLLSCRAHETREEDTMTTRRGKRPSHWHSSSRYSKSSFARGNTAAQSAACLQESARH